MGTRWTDRPPNRELATELPIRPVASDPVSVVIPHYGDPAVTRRLVDALRSQTGSCHVEIVVADDASPTPFRESHGATVVRSNTNRGFGAAVNLGVSAARQPWLLILNSDVEVGPEFVQDLLTKAAPLQPAICTVPQLDPASGRHNPPALRYPTVTSTVAHQSRTLRAFNGTTWWARLTRAPAAQHTSPGAVEWVSGAVMLMPLRLFRRLGGFDEGFFLYWEEVDLQRRARAAGVPSVVLARPEVSHLGGHSTGGIDRDVERTRSRIRYERRARGPAASAVLIALLAASSVVDGAADVVRLAVGRPAHPWRDTRRSLTVLARSLRRRTSG